MKNVAILSNDERQELFRNTADKMGLHDAIIEKDFWVCYTLDYLFHRSKWKKCRAFKGGTSLSKAFHLIHRFSEDIDLILDWQVIGYRKDNKAVKASGKIVIKAFTVSKFSFIYCRNTEEIIIFATFFGKLISALANGKLTQT